VAAEALAGFAGVERRFSTYLERFGRLTGRDS